MKFNRNHLSAIIIVIFVILFINTITAGSIRSYIWEGTNRRFANRLENCRRYSTPVVYRAPIIIPVDKHKTQIIGKKDGACVIREYYADTLIPFNHYNEYRLSLEVAKELSEILKTAFKEPMYKEEKAAALALQFKKKYGAFCGYEEGDFYSNQRCIKESLGSPLFNADNREKVESIRLQLENDSSICKQMQQTAKFLISQTPDFYNLSLEEKEQKLCPDILMNEKYRLADYTFDNHKTRLVCECGSRIRYGGCVIRREITDSIQRSYCLFFLTSGGIKDIDYWQANISRILAGNSYY